MTAIIKHWIVKKLGLPLSFDRGGDRLRQELSNGRIIGEILRKYHLISDDMLMNIPDSVCRDDREKNINILHHWLMGMSFDVEMQELIEIRQGKPGAALSVLYRMYLWLEGPGSQPGIQPRQKRAETVTVSEDTVEGRDIWIPYLTERYIGSQANATEGLAFEDLANEKKRKEQWKDSLVVNGLSNTDLENGEEEAIALEDVESFPELKSASFLEGLKESLAYKGVAGEKPKLVVSLSSVLPEEYAENLIDGKPSTAFNTSTAGEEGKYKAVSVGTQMTDSTFEPYIEVDDRGLDALACGQLPSFYVRNRPYGNTNEKLQAGHVYFHNKAMMILEEQRISVKQEIKPKSLRKSSENQSYIGAYEEALRFRKEKKQKRTLMTMENTMSDMNKFDEKLKQNSGNSDACEDFVIKIYPNGRGDWTEASSKINSLKSRRRREKITFQKRCNMRKMMAAALAKMGSCEMQKELDITIHSKLPQKSKQETMLAEYCTTSHLEKTAFLEHIKYEEEQLLQMAMIQNYKEYLHAEQLTDVKSKVEKITEECDEQIMHEAQASKRKAQFIMDIKFCEEIFTVIFKTAVQYSAYRSEYGSDPPTALVAEWRESFYLGSCVTMVKQQIKDAKPKSDKYAQEHAKRCKTKKQKEKEKALAIALEKKSKQSMKGNSSLNSLQRMMATIDEDVEEEELAIYHPRSDEKHKKKKGHSGKKNKHKDVQKTTSMESKVSTHSVKDDKGSNTNLNGPSKIRKGSKKAHVDPNDKKVRKEGKRKNSKDPKGPNSSSQIDQEAPTKRKKSKKVSNDTGEPNQTEKESKQLTKDKDPEENQKNGTNSGKKKPEVEKPLKKDPSKTKKASKNKAPKKNLKGNKEQGPEKNNAAADEDEEEEEDELPADIKTKVKPKTEKEKKTKKATSKPKKTKE